jgi:hypothetical protein
MQRTAKLFPHAQRCDSCVEHFLEKFHGRAPLFCKFRTLRLRVDAIAMIFSVTTPSISITVPNFLATKENRRANSP